MSLTISIPDALRQSVEAATGGKNTVLYDDKGNPSIMVVVPRFNLSDLDGFADTIVHPAFVKGNEIRNEIFIGKFESIVYNERALSIPGVCPTDSINFDNAVLYCRNKGPGWHLMTAAERAAIYLWCTKNGYIPTGNTNLGHDITYPCQCGRIANENGIILTGSGPVQWHHDKSPAGISDLVGNLMEWVAGMRLKNGEINIIENNNAADLFCDMSDAHTNWKGILQDGSLVASGTTGTLKYNINGTTLEVKTTISTSGIFSLYQFKNIVAAAGVTIPDILKALGLYPTNANDTSKWYATNQTGIKMAIVGPGRDWGYDCGMNSLDWYCERTTESSAIGFRCAYITP